MAAKARTKAVTPPEQEGWPRTLQLPDGLWLKFSDPNDLPYGLLRRFQKAQLVIQRALRPGAALDEDEEWVLGITEEVLKGTIVETNVPGLDMDADDPFEHMKGSHFRAVAMEVMSYLNGGDKSQGAR